MIEILNESDFTEKVLKAPGKVLIELFATWCPHCQRMMPIIEDVAQRESGKVTVYQVDVDKSPELTQEYAPNGFPTFDLFEGGTLVARKEGEQPESSLIELVS